MHFESESIHLQFAVREFPGCERFPLAPITLPLTGVSDGLALDGLSYVLATAFGFKRTSEDAITRARRWAPTGGNLGSPQAYLAISNIEGLANGYYAYSAYEHSLVLLQADAELVDEGVEIVIVSEFDRVWRKYGTFSYRVVSLDAGVALTNLALMSTHIGLKMSNLTSWDEHDIAKRFGIDLFTQAVTARVILGEGTC